MLTQPSRRHRTWSSAFEAGGAKQGEAAGSLDLDVDELAREARGVAIEYHDL